MCPTLGRRLSCGQLTACVMEVGGPKEGRKNGRSLRGTLTPHTMKTEGAEEGIICNAAFTALNRYHV